MEPQKEFVSIFGPIVSPFESPKKEWTYGVTYKNLGAMCPCEGLSGSEMIQSDLNGCNYLQESEGQLSLQFVV